MGDLDKQGGAAWWSAALDQLFAGMDCSASGLTSEAARVRSCAVGPNVVSEERDQRWERLLLAQFASPLVLILVFGALVSLVLRDWVEAGIILAIVAGSALFGFAQEFRASKAVAELQGRIALKVRARRDGEVQSLPAATSFRETWSCSRRGTSFRRTAASSRPAIFS